jgi:hypothetical protein
VLAAFILEHLVQEILSAPPSQCMPDDARVSMTLRQLLYRGDIEVERIDVGVQISPSKKNAQVQQRRRCFSVR